MGVRAEKMSSARLSELMSVETIRQYLKRSRPRRPAGSLACGIRPSVRRWPHFTVNPARHGRLNDSVSAGLSRSVFAERFTDLVGRPPMLYLALWHIQLASRCSCRWETGVGSRDRRGLRVRSAAFSRAFKKLVGQSPATWRRGTEMMPATTTASAVAETRSPIRERGRSPSRQ